MAIHIKNQQRSTTLNLRKIRKDLAAALSLLGREEAELSILFVGSAKMKQLNRQYRGIPKETDVLSFPMEDAQAASLHTSPLTRHASFRTPPLLGDIAISVPKTVAQAKACGTPFPEELLRLLIHGLLHLLDYDHEKSVYQKVRMEKKEKEIFHAVARLA
jgi:probable rRNA maturation factor